MATIQVRIDDKTKKSAKKVLDDLGLDMSTAIKVFLKQVIVKQGVPFQLLTENGFTLQEEKEILKAAKEAKKHINTTPPLSAEEAVKHLNDND